jgi:hypothetical protein
VALDPKKAALIPARNLPKIINEAILQAEARLGGIVTEPKIVRKWELIGRVCRTLPEAERFATEVSAQLGPNVSPGLIKIDDKILAGFIERLKVPQVGF